MYIARTKMLFMHKNYVTIKMLPSEERSVIIIIAFILRQKGRKKKKKLKQNHA